MITLRVSGYPRSGTTWLTRLLADALDCRSGGSVPSEDRKEPAAEGFNRANQEITVRKGHYRLIRAQGQTAAPKKHTLNLLGLGEDERIALIVRDPRDVLISQAAYWRNSLQEQLNHMLSGVGSMRYHGPWDEWHDAYWTIDIPNLVYIRYEDLRVRTRDIAGTLLLRLAPEYKELIMERLAGAVQRQSFRQRRRWMKRYGDRIPLGMAHQLHSMRVAKVGQWQGQLHKAHAKLIEHKWGVWLRLLDYEKDADWWKESA